MIPLFALYPGIADSLPYLSLGNFPVPVREMDGLCRETGRDGLYIKRDDLSGDLYGGNKVRKLEFVLAKAVSEGATRVITSGAAGSNHALATAMYASRAGLKVDLMLVEQESTASVRENLLADFSTGAVMHLDRSFESLLKSIRALVEYYTEKEGHKPFVIPPGGTTAEGVAGYVNAAFELRDQIISGQIPCPQLIYVAFGTMGTAAGLFLGLKAAGLPCTLKAVRVVPSYMADRSKCLELIESANRLLHDADPAFPVCQFKESDLTIEENYLGSGYGVVTDEARDGMEIISRSEGIHLDGVYSGKAFAAFLDEARNGKTGDILFWNTKSSRPLPESALKTDYHLLPPEFHHYFQEKE